MKSTSWLTTIAIAGWLAVSSPVILPAINRTSLQASAQDAMGQSEIAKISAVKGKPESAQLMRQFYKDLTPIGIQPGGAGMVVNLYSKSKIQPCRFAQPLMWLLQLRKAGLSSSHPQR